MWIRRALALVAAASSQRVPRTVASRPSSTVYGLDVKTMPVDGCWSISVCNAEGDFREKPYDAWLPMPRVA